MTEPELDAAIRWKARLCKFDGNLSTSIKPIVSGKLTRIVGQTLEAVGCEAALGDRCLIERPDGESLIADVVGFENSRIFLMPSFQPSGLAPNARVSPIGGRANAAVGFGLLGRVLNGVGEALDGRGPVETSAYWPLAGVTRNPLDRQIINNQLDVGIRSVNALISVGRGQRLGLFAPSGVGKSVLLSMMARYTDADVIVVALIGERGREVQEFIEENLGPESLARAVVVAVPADTQPIMRIRGAELASSVAEFFRAQGKHVLLLMDSLTRYAQARREISLTMGEPPATRGYPPSVFAELPKLVERAGNGTASEGSITAFYTVLTDVDQDNDPIAEAARAILDGHIILSRDLAERGLYPAIDIESSVSRVVNRIVSPEQLKFSRAFKKFYSVFESNRDLFSIGAYQAGGNLELDKAVELYPQLESFLNQQMHEPVDIFSAQQQLAQIFTPQ
ncbi:MAG: FliI/YscN family ATPase [Pseudomonadota bacterium]